MFKINSKICSKNILLSVDELSSMLVILFSLFDIISVVVFIICNVAASLVLWSFPRILNYYIRTNR